jgi:hypothetical protein
MEYVLFQPMYYNFFQAHNRNSALPKAPGVKSQSISANSDSRAVPEHQLPTVGASTSTAPAPAGPTLRSRTTRTTD